MAINHRAYYPLVTIRGLSDMGLELEYLKNACEKCGSRNITPYDKRQVGEKSICKYVCEHCGHTMDDTLYAERREITPSVNR